MPLISIIVPCYNEEATIGFLLDAILRQTFPLLETEVIISDGLSTDHTREVISSYQRDHPELSVRIVDNNLRNIPSGLNRAIEASTGKYIIRLDAHSMPSPNYFEYCVKALEAGKGENVGGVWRIKPGMNNWIARSIAAAASHPFAVGDAQYRVGGDAKAVDTVPFGAFHRELIERVGPFDESLLTNEDYEFNVRVRKSGGKVWFDPKIQSTYIARSTLGELARQYWRYGYWKARMLRKYPTSIKWRQALPPMFVLSIFFWGILSYFTTYARWLLLTEILLYILIILIVGIFLSIKHLYIGYLFGVPLAIATMHVSWGSAFLWGLMTTIRTNPLFNRNR